jgi:hypothetical protein
LHLADKVDERDGTVGHAFAENGPAALPGGHKGQDNHADDEREPATGRNLNYLNFVPTRGQTIKR